MPYQSASSLLVVIGAFNAAAGLLWGIDHLHKGVSYLLKSSCLSTLLKSVSRKLAALCSLSTTQYLIDVCSMSLLCYFTLETSPYWKRFIFFCSRKTRRTYRCVFEAHQKIDTCLESWLHEYMFNQCQELIAYKCFFKLTIKLVKLSLICPHCGYMPIIVGTTCASWITLFSNSDEPTGDRSSEHSSHQLFLFAWLVKVNCFRRRYQRQAIQVLWNVNPLYAS